MDREGQGLLLVVSGPAGVGKGTVNRVLMERHPSIRMSVSATTRSPRPGEVDGVHYFFKTEDEFRRMIAEDAFLEHMQVFRSHFYGTPRAYVEEQLQQANDVILEIDVQGAMQVKKSYPQAILIFIAPPSMPILKARLVGRGTETPEAVEKRFATATSEVAMIAHYDYVIVNEELETAVGNMEAILAAERCKSTRNAQLIRNLIGGTDRYDEQTRAQ